MTKEEQLAQREVRSFLVPREPSIDRYFRPKLDRRVRLFDKIQEENHSEDNASEASSYDDDVMRSVDEELSSKASSTTEGGCSTTCSDESGALVYLRLRPIDCPSAAYTISKEGNVLITGLLSETAGTSKNKNTIEKHYSFSAIFDSQVDQCEVYQKCIGRRIEDEENFTIMTYGTSGSGKTFTLLGDNDHPGIIPRALENIFTLYAANIYPQPSLKLVNARITIMDDDATAKESLLRRQILNCCPDLHTQHAHIQQSIRTDHSFETNNLGNVSVLIWVSFVEIYNEFVYDLLSIIPVNNGPQPNNARKNLKIVCNDGKVFIKGVTSVYVKNSLEALKLLNYGLQKLTFASTSINANSSRSHCIFFIDVLKYFRSGLITETSYKFCDLAGSERLGKTGNVGSRLKEAQRINTSLMVLGRCLDAANASERRHERIPFRESKLTMLLQSALLGKEKLAMIVNVAPTDKYYEENLNVLSFASIAKNIIFKPPPVKQNRSRYSAFMEYSKASESDNSANNEYIQQLLEENIFLNEEIARLTTSHSEELFKQEHELRNKLVDSFQATLAQNKRQFEIRLQQELDNQKRYYESKINALKRQHEAEIEDLREEWSNNDKENFCEGIPKKRHSSN